jgi:hypothetical protein
MAACLGMEIVGDIERFVAANLYPLRLPLAIAAVLALAGLAWLARRRGWLGPAQAGSWSSAVVLAAA